MRAEAIDNSADRAGLKRVLVLVIIAREELGLRRVHFGFVWLSRAGECTGRLVSSRNHDEVSLFV
jgi:hypothetical protein